MKQTTVKSAVSCKGVGLHTGKNSFIEFRPALTNSGIYFVHGGDIIKAAAGNITNTQRGSRLKDISTVEHVLAAVSGMGIDNIEIYLDGPEPPALDGSAVEFVGMINRAGIAKQDAPAKTIRVDRPIKVESKDSYVEIVPYNGFTVEAFIDYSHTHVGIVKAAFDIDTDNFEKDVAPARTFGLIEEVDALKKAGLAKGASFDNAVAITKTGFSTPLRFANELARHKIVDIIGDMALVGSRLRGKIVSHKGGHRLNIELARRILDGTNKY